MSLSNLVWGFGRFLFCNLSSFSDQRWPQYGDGNINHTHVQNLFFSYFSKYVNNYLRYCWSSSLGIPRCSKHLFRNRSVVLETCKGRRKKITYFFADMSANHGPPLTLNKKGEIFCLFAYPQDILFTPYLKLTVVLWDGSVVHA